jgi:hypothetical protein
MGFEEYGVDRSRRAVLKRRMRERRRRERGGGEDVRVG